VLNAKCVRVDRPKLARLVSEPAGGDLFIAPQCTLTSFVLQRRGGGARWSRLRLMAAAPLLYVAFPTFGDTAGSWHLLRSSIAGLAEMLWGGTKTQDRSRTLRALQ
jgi:hypothetical protein